MLIQVKSQFPAKLEPLFTPKRYKIVYGGRGGAKSWGIARALLILGTKAKLRILCAREFQNSIADSVHKLLSDQIETLGLSTFYSVQEKTIKGANGTEFFFEGLRHNVRKIKSYEGIDICWVEEAQDVSKDSWTKLIPTIRKTGSEIWVSFNPEFEDDETYQRFVLKPPAESFVIFINWRDNPWFAGTELEAERLDLKRLDPDGYEHVYEGKCRNWLEGAIYANELRAAYESGRICSVPWDENADVFTAWDLGYTDDLAIWWYQLIQGEIHVIDTYSVSGASPSRVCSQLLGREVDISIIRGDLVVTKGDVIEEIAHRSTYDYAMHWLPHDARAKTLQAHGKSFQQQLQAVVGYDKVRIVPGLSKEDGIYAARTTFPRCWFDQEKTADGLKALRKYKREMQRDEVSLQKKPKHDWTSHFADAWRMLAVAWQEEIDGPAKSTTKPDDYGIDDHEDTGENWKTT